MNIASIAHKTLDNIPFGAEAELLLIHLKHQWRDGWPKQADNDIHQKWLETIWKDGYCVIENYFDAKTCDALAQETDAIAEQYPDAIKWYSNKADRRMYGVEKASPLIAEKFGANEELVGFANTFCRASSMNAFTLAGKIKAAKGNLGSGEGWHRDDWGNQFKSIVYLTDVKEGNGPFQYIKGSHKPWQMVQDMRTAGLGPRDVRITNEQVDQILENDPAKLVTFTASKGTLILANTTGIHRGQPISKGERYALTNYFIRNSQMTDAFADHFAPVLGRHISV